MKLSYPWILLASWIIPTCLLYKITWGMMALGTYFRGCVPMYYAHTMSVYLKYRALFYRITSLSIQSVYTMRWASVVYITIHNMSKYSGSSRMVFNALHNYSSEAKLTKLQTFLCILNGCQFITWEGLTTTFEASTNVCCATDFLILLLLSSC